VKYHTFIVPGATRRSDGTINIAYYRVKITIDALTPNYYPRVYAKKNTRLNSPSSLGALDFPTPNNYLYFFGDQPVKQLSKTRFEYEFTNSSSGPWVFWTLAVYQHNWGITDMKKAEYQIRISADRIPRCDAVFCDGPNAG
jgi:hypothetical protein